MRPARGYRDRVTTPGDESRTELAWREIVEHYGDRPVLPDAESTSASLAGSAADVPEPDPRLSDEAEELDLEEEVADVDRFRPPAAPPFPRPRTWQRGLAWAGIFVAPTLAVLIGLLSIYVPSVVGWVLVTWFVGGFLYLVREMPRSPRDPWDDGSRI